MSRAPNPQLAIDFVNTVDWRNDPAQFKELLTTIDDFIRWAQQHGTIADAVARKLSRHGREHPKVAGVFLDRAKLLRDAIYRAFSAVAARRQASGEDLRSIGQAMAEFADRIWLRPSGDGFAWEWDGEDDSFDRMLWPVLKSATDLLTSDLLDRIRECEGPGCGWILLDQTKNRSKRWCSMEGCGNRAKVRRFYERHKKETAKA